MTVETRRQYLERFLEEFINDSNRSFTKLDLYKDEIRRLSKDYADKIKIERGEKTAASAEDKRYNCKIYKNK